MVNEASRQNAGTPIGIGYHHVHRAGLVGRRRNGHRTGVQEIHHQRFLPSDGHLAIFQQADSRDGHQTFPCCGGSRWVQGQNPQRLGFGRRGPPRAPRRAGVGGEARTEVDLVGPVGIHHHDFFVAVPIARKGNLGTVRRPGRPVILISIGGEPHRVGTVDSHNIDGPAATPTGRKGDFGTVRRPGWELIGGGVLGKTQRV